MADNKETQSNDQQPIANTAAPKTPKPQRKPGLIKALWAGKKKQTVAKDSGVVTGEFKESHRLLGVRHINLSALKTRRGAVIAIAAIYLVAAIAGFIFWRVQESQKPVVTKLPSEKEYVSGKIDSLEQDTPPADASKKEQIQYYDKLQNYYDLAGDYKKAAETFEKRVSIQSSDLDYRDYSTAARYYRETGDKTKAIAAIDKAIALLPPTPDEKTGYDPAVTKQGMLNFKEELKK